MPRGKPSGAPESPTGSEKRCDQCGLWQGGGGLAGLPAACPPTTQPQAAMNVPASMPTACRRLHTPPRPKRGSHILHDGVDIRLRVLLAVFIHGPYPLQRRMLLRDRDCHKRTGPRTIPPISRVWKALVRRPRGLA